MATTLPALRYPELTPTKAVAQIPQISGESYQHVGRYAGAVVLACFEQIGGLPRMVQWADANPDDFYTKSFPKLIQRSTQVDVSHTVTIDDAISNLDRQIIEADYTEVTSVKDQFYDI